MTEVPSPKTVGKISLLPISTQRFGWWLFLSASVMMLAGVIGASYVLRSGVPEGQWPEPSWVKSHWCIGMVTIVLLLSTCWFLRQDQKRLHVIARQSANNMPWLAFALLFAAFSICVIGLDYQSKIALGLFPDRDQPVVHGKLDLRYLSSVTARANDHIASLEKQAETDSRAPKTLKHWNLIREGLINWTRRKVGQSDDPTIRELSLAQMADQIYSTQPDPRLEKFTEDEIAEVKLSLDKALAQKNNIAPEETVAIETLQRTVDQLQQRLRYLDSINDDMSALRPLIGETLPKFIPGGPTWIANYWLLTGFLMIQLTIGTVSLLHLLAAKSLGPAADPLGTLQNVTAFWYFVVITGIIVSWLVWFG